ncbi:MAG TPA: cupredoxin family copper-binding protein [Longimicrobiaceae bacterium]|nr:cupredoxin family copper-binding protein [Longimicrobiaceae bacterium]
MLDELRIVAVMGVVSFGLSACAPGDSQADAPPVAHSVTIEGFLYLPPSLTVNAGDTVVWLNKDLVPHTATAPTAGLNTGSIAAGESSRVVMNESGEYSYKCAFHPNMEGIVIVQ